MKSKRYIAFIIFIIVLVVGTIARTQGVYSPSQESEQGWYYHNPEMVWLDSVMRQMSIEEKIAQMMIVRVPQNMDAEAEKRFVEEVAKKGYGGVCFFKSTAEKQLHTTKMLREKRGVPTMITIDGEWGLGMRLTDMFSFPRNAEYAKLKEDGYEIVYRTGEEIGRQCRMMGIDMNFAPVADVNTNPRNPVIGSRAYGNDPKKAALLTERYAAGMMSQGVMAVAKHFPGHGDTDADSHKQLPVIRHTAEYIDSVDLYPFRHLIGKNISCIMVAHLLVDAYDGQYPSSLSRKIVTDLLKKRLKYRGLIVTDGLDMRAITNTYRNGEAEYLAMMAGNDLLLLPSNPEKAIEHICQKASSNDTVRGLIDYHCRRVLRMKYHNVVPYMNIPLTIPDSNDIQRCKDIVADLRLATNRSIDSIVRDGIQRHAMPGCQVVVLHKGKTVINRNYGYYTYDSKSKKVDGNTMYDVASCTKVLATTLAVMKLYEQERIHLDDPLSKYLPYLKGTDKEEITIRQTMSHFACLKSFDAYWSVSCCRDTILNLIANTPQYKKQRYVYSDNGFILLGDMVERITYSTLDDYVARMFYRPMGLTSTTFKPIENHIAQYFIAPTEIDSIRGLIQGRVHDPNANALGGVSGHAGLFSTAYEVAQVMQMLLDKGVYKERRYFEAATIDTFNTRYYAECENRRGLGFDKQMLEPSKVAPVAEEASQSSFGHTGFTGTMVWVDPKDEIVYVFLSNRVYPSATPNRLSQLNIRTNIQSEIYKTLRQ